jgi:hypothetical protein
VLAPQRAALDALAGYLGEHADRLDYSQQLAEGRRSARRAIAEYIDYYQTECKHSAFGYLTPNQFESLHRPVVEGVPLFVPTAAPQRTG